jgi:hypothetical protein
MSRLDLGVLSQRLCNINKEHPNLSYQATMQRLRDSIRIPTLSIIFLSLQCNGLCPQGPPAQQLHCGYLFSPYHSAPAIFAIDIETWIGRIGFFWWFGEAGVASSSLLVFFLIALVITSCCPYG